MKSLKFLTIIFLLTLASMEVSAQRLLKLKEKDEAKIIQVPGREPGKTFAIIVESPDPDGKLIAIFKPQQPINIKSSYSEGRHIYFFEMEEDQDEYDLTQLYTSPTSKFNRFTIIKKEDQPVTFKKGEDSKIFVVKLIDETSEIAEQGKGNLTIEIRSDKGKLVPSGTIEFQGLPNPVTFTNGFYIYPNPNKVKLPAKVKAPGFEDLNEVLVDFTIVEPGQNKRFPIEMKGKYGKVVLIASKAKETDKISGVSVQLDNGETVQFTNEERLEIELPIGSHKIEVLAETKGFASIAPIQVEIEQNKSIERTVDFASFQDIEISTKPEGAQMTIMEINGNPFNGQQPSGKTNRTYNLPVGRLRVEFRHPSTRTVTVLVDNTSAKNGQTKSQNIELDAAFFPWAVQTQPSGLSFKIKDQNGSLKESGRTPAVKFLPAGTYELEVDDDNRWYEASVTLKDASDGNLVFKTHGSFGGSIFMGSGTAFSGAERGLGNVKAEALNYEVGFLNFGWGGFNLTALGMRRLALPSNEGGTIPAYFFTAFTNPELRIGGSYLDWLEGFVFVGGGYYFSPFEYDSHKTLGRFNGSMTYYRAGIGGSLILGDLRFTVKAGVEDYTVTAKEYDAILGSYRDEFTYKSGLNPFFSLEVDLFSMADYGGKIWRLWSKPLLDNFTY